MPQRRNAIKALRINKKKHLHNLQIKTDLRKALKKFLVTVEQKNIEEANAALRIAFKKIDKAAKRHLFHKNTAARRKSRLSRLLLGITKK